MPTLGFSHWLVAIIIAPLIGSFLELLADRLPAGGPIALARSACPDCGKTGDPGRTP